ncbi:GH92 family glycosyl hydrolase [Georgenia alba]|uniref:GH92 family glycosyl hydrolase n=1 Tax=Georgenia alba TaxID=2233858 RepID=A0ABW2Q9F0_9MICO
MSTGFATSFEVGQPVPGVPVPAGWSVEVSGGPEHLPAGRPRAGLTGPRSLRVHAPGPGRAVLLDGLDVPVAAGTELSYAVCPVLEPDLAYRGTWAALDCRFDDGTWLSDLDPVDQHGMRATAAGQGAAKILLPDHWNLVRVALAKAVGRRVTTLAVVLEQPGDGEPVEVWWDDVAIAVPDRPARRDPVDHVDTRRGTHSSGAYSRGNTVPATAVPNGFGLLVPLTDATSHSWLYSWAGHNGPDNRPRLEGVGVSHVPSPWMGDRNQVAFHLAAGEDVPDATPAARGLGFDHGQEIARPHRYGVPLDGGHRVDVTPTDHGGVLLFTFPAGTARGHVLVDAVSTDGAGPDGPCELTWHADGTLSGWVETGSGLSVGRSRMFVAGRLDAPVVAHGAARGNRPHARYATIDLDGLDGLDGRDGPGGPGGGRAVELRVATSFVGLEQAWHTYDLELAGRTFEEVEAAARTAWEQRLAVVEVEGASEEQLATLYGNLYRLNLYPSSQWENAGSAAEPRPVHASPVSDPPGRVLPGELYVNHGFWDTYRTCWSAYALLYPELAGRLADGFVQQFRDGGWVARWSSPGYADLMTGTSSDVAFADLLLRDVLLPDPEGTYVAGLRNATAAPTEPGVGRKGLAHATYRGWVARDEDVHESVSWSLEGYINDLALARMARRLATGAGPAGTSPPPPAESSTLCRVVNDVPAGRAPRHVRRLLDEATYLEQRAGGYRHLFDAATGFLRGRGRDGAFAEPFDPRDWGGDFTESDAWNFAFHAPHDPAGLAELHGGPEGLADVLEEFFATPERADRPGGYGGVIHEMVEARDVRMGQLGQSNQVSHHIPYIWLAAGRPDRAQETVREILVRLWTGSEIGQGYHGDEDNGEMSAWWLLSALGLYPLEVGSSRWAAGSPLFTRAVVHRPDGDLVVEAPGNAPEAPYVQGLELDGLPVPAPVLEHGALRGGATLRFTMAQTPGDWGRDAPLTFPRPPLRPWRDMSGAGSWRLTPDAGPSCPAPGTEQPELTALGDDSYDSAADLPAGRLTWQAGGTTDVPSPEPQLRCYTLTSAVDGRAAPSAWRLEVRGKDGGWRVVDEREDEVFPWPGQLRPFVLAEPVALRDVRLVLATPGALAEVELLTA